MKFFLIIALIFFTNEIKAGKIDCEFSDENVGKENFYKCTVNYLSTYRIDGVNGKHLNGKSNENVEFFQVKNSSLQFLPRGLHETFPSLKFISITAENFTEILRDDLKPFGENLITLLLFKTKIMNFPVDLFKDTPNIGLLTLEAPIGHEVGHVKREMFDSIENLFLLSIKFTCITAVDHRRGEIENLLENIEFRCSANFEGQTLDRDEIERMHEPEEPKPETEKPDEPQKSDESENPQPNLKNNEDDE